MSEEPKLTKPELEKLDERTERDRESNGNASAINDWDINAMSGGRSIGPMRITGSNISEGIVTKSHLSTVAENGPEVFMPLHDPTSARRFLDFIQELAEREGQE